MSCRPRRRAALASAVLTIATALTALPACPDANGKAPEQRCIKAYEKCTLASGVLGVCDNIPCTSGQPEPCFVCRSQH